MTDDEAPPGAPIRERGEPARVVPAGAGFDDGLSESSIAEAATADPQFAAAMAALLRPRTAPLSSTDGPTADAPTDDAVDNDGIEDGLSEASIAEAATADPQFAAAMAALLVPAGAPSAVPGSALPGSAGPGSAEPGSAGPGSAGPGNAVSDSAASDRAMSGNADYPERSARRRARWAREDRDADASTNSDWRWVEEWRETAEPTPWGPGLALAGFAALIIGSAVYVISEGLADSPIIAVLANIVVAAGLSPALWMSRHLPVLRWISLGGALGTVIAWISILFFPQFR